MYFSKTIVDVPLQRGAVRLAFVAKCPHARASRKNVDSHTNLQLQ